jgi:hypothetical protein
MDSKYVRTIVENLLAELERNPSIGRRPSTSFMSRYGRPLGLGIAMGVGGVAGCSGDALPPRVDAYGVVADRPVEMLSPAADADALDVRISDLVDASDVLPPRVDAYGVVADRPVEVSSPAADAADADGTMALDALDARIPDGSADAKEVLPPPVDAYGMVADRPREALPPPVDAYGVIAPDASVVDAGHDVSPGDSH